LAKSHLSSNGQGGVGKTEKGKKNDGSLQTQSKDELALFPESDDRMGAKEGKNTSPGWGNRFSLDVQDQERKKRGKRYGPSETPVSIA